LVKPRYLNQHVLLVSNDPDEVCAMTGRLWVKNHSQVVGQDAYSMRLHHAKLRQGSLTYVECTARVHAEVMGDSGHYWLLIPLEGGVDLALNGHELRARPGHLLVQPPRLHLHFRAQPAQGLILVLPATLVNAARAAHGEFDAQATEPGWSIPLDQIASFHDLMLLAARELDCVAHPPTALYLRNLEGFLAASLARALAARQPAGSGWQPLVGRAQLLSLRDWIVSHADEPLAIEQIARECGLGLRALEKNFRLHCGGTPTAFLRRVRLDRARQRLSDPASIKSVTDIALESGFFHLGRFAGAYRKQFGESPCETLRQARRS
jgi:AraC-like DNA-binding protein